MPDCVTACRDPGRRLAKWVASPLTVLPAAFALLLVVGWDVLPAQAAGCVKGAVVYLCSHYSMSSEGLGHPFPQFVTAIRRLQTLRHLHACSGCFRLERIAGWALHFPADEKTVSFCGFRDHGAFADAAARLLQKVRTQL
jgi:hypothetical protein